MCSGVFKLNACEFDSRNQSHLRNETRPPVPPTSGCFLREAAVTLSIFIRHAQRLKPLQGPAPGRRRRPDRGAAGARVVCRPAAASSGRRRRGPTGRRRRRSRRGRGSPCAIRASSRRPRSPAGAGGRCSLGCPALRRLSPGPGGATRRGPGREGKRGRGTREWAGGTRTGGRGKGERIEMGGVQRIRRAHHMKRILNCASQ